MFFIRNIFLRLVFGFVSSILWAMEHYLHFRLLRALCGVFPPFLLIFWRESSFFHFWSRDYFFYHSRFLLLFLFTLSLSKTLVWEKLSHVTLPFSFSLFIITFLFCFLTLASANEEKQSDGFTNWERCLGHVWH